MGSKNEGSYLQRLGSFLRQTIGLTPAPTEVDDQTRNDVEQSANNETPVLSNQINNYAESYQVDNPILPPDDDVNHIRELNSEKIVGPKHSDENEHVLSRKLNGLFPTVEDGHPGYEYRG